VQGTPAEHNQRGRDVRSIDWLDELTPDCRASRAPATGWGTLFACLHRVPQANPRQAPARVRLLYSDTAMNQLAAGKAAA